MDNPAHQLDQGDRELITAMFAKPSDFHPRIPHGVAAGVIVFSSFFIVGGVPIPTYTMVGDMDNALWVNNCATGTLRRLPRPFQMFQPRN
jgi:hypothetical protein